MKPPLEPYIIGPDWHVDDVGLISIHDACLRVGGNTGNLAFSYAIARHLDLTKGIPTRWGELTETYKSSKDKAGIFAMANVLGSHVNLSALASEYENVSHYLSVIGIGAQSSIGAEKVEIPEGTIRFLEVVARKRYGSFPNIAVRGDFTLKVLKEYGLDDCCVSLGCPSLFISPNPQLGETIFQSINKGMQTTLAVCAAHYRWAHLRRIEGELVKLIDYHNGKYIIQSPLEMLQLVSSAPDHIDPAILESCRCLLHEDLSTSGFIHWLRTRSASFYSAAEWMNSIRQYQFVVGFRIHGIMLALQAGIPGLCLVHDSRTLELCEKMMIPHLRPEDIPNNVSLDFLTQSFKSQFDPYEFDKNRLNLLSLYVSFLSANGVRPASYLNAMVK